MCFAPFLNALRPLDPNLKYCQFSWFFDFFIFGLEYFDYRNFDNFSFVGTKKKKKKSKKISLVSFILPMYPFVHHISFCNLLFVIFDQIPKFHLWDKKKDPQMNILRSRNFYHQKIWNLSFPTHFRTSS